MKLLIAAGFVLATLLIPSLSHSESWTRTYDYPGQQEEHNRRQLQQEALEHQKKMDEEQIMLERRQQQIEAERIKADREKMEMEKNQGGGVAQRPLNPTRFNYGQPLQQQTGRGQ